MNRKGPTMRLANVLKKYRLHQEMDQRTLAKRIGIGASTLYRFERGDGIPDGFTIGKVLTWLLSEEEPTHE